MNSPWDGICATNREMILELGREGFHAQIVGTIYNPETLAEWLKEKNALHDKELGEATIHFLIEERWPEMPWEHRLLLYVRAQHAQTLLMQLSQTMNDAPLIVPNEHTEPARLIFWLMSGWPESLELHFPIAARELLKQT